MTSPPPVSSVVEAEARKVFGDEARGWMARPSRLLDGIMPAELATSPEGARVVLYEINQIRPAAVKAAAGGSKRRA